MRASFTLSQFCPGGISHSGKPAPLPGNARDLLPAGALRSYVAGTYGSPTNAPSQNAVQGFVVDSACAAAFFHRGIIPLLTLFFSAYGSQKTAVTPLEEGRQMPFGLPPPAGGSVPWRPPMSERVGGHLLLSHSSGPEESHTPANPPHFLGTPENCSPLGGLRLVRFLL